MIKIGFFNSFFFLNKQNDIISTIVFMAMRACNVLKFYFFFFSCHLKMIGDNSKQNQQEKIDRGEKSYRKKKKTKILKYIKVLKPNVEFRKIKLWSFSDFKWRICMCVPHSLSLPTFSVHGIRNINKKRYQHYGGRHIRWI